MSFNRGSQPITQDTGKLAISCCKVLVDGASVGAFKGITFDLDGETRDISAGYPLRPITQVLDSQSAKASVDCEELGGAAKTLLTAIIGSLNTSVVPTKNVQLEVFRPLSENILIDMTGAALLQEFELSFSYDFNSVNFTFEQIVPTGQPLSSRVGFSIAGVVTNASGSPMLDTGDLSLGLPLVSAGGSVGAVQSVRLVLTTEYKRYEAGYPRTLFKLTPLSHKVVLEVELEELSDSLLAEDLLGILGTATPVSISVALYDGTAILLTLPEAVLSPAGGPSISQDDWGTKTRRFTATGATLLTIA